jgi:hypothetical protein
MPDRPATPRTGLTAFAGAEASLRKRCKNASIDAAEFQRGISRCSLSSCRGTCCYDGVSVDDDTAAVLQNLATRRKSDFERMRLALPEAVIVESESDGVVTKKTAVKPFPFRSLVSGYPQHFNETACVFLLGDGRCGLQLLAQEEGKHRWYYKPFICWLHPIKIAEGAIRLYDETTDPYKSPDYDGFVVRTFCGRTAAGGLPASEVLKEELRFLERLLDHDLSNEAEIPISDLKNSGSD